MASLLENNENKGNMTLLAEIRSIEYKTSQYGNKYAKIVFADQTGEDRMYLFGKLYEKMISKCFIGRIYLLTVKKSDDVTKIDIVNFMLANEILSDSIASKTMHVTTTISKLQELRMYLKCYMMGDVTDVTVILSDIGMNVPSVCQVKLDNENLLEMNKKGFKILLQ
jgi:DNA polymerase III alpha subunit